MKTSPQDKAQKNPDANFEQGEPVAIVTRVPVGNGGPVAPFRQQPEMGMGIIEMDREIGREVKQGSEGEPGQKVGRAQPLGGGQADDQKGDVEGAELPTVTASDQGGW